jgi:hypothetical protein
MPSPFNSRWRRVRRGDTLSFTVTAALFSTTSEYGTVWPGELYPPRTAPVSVLGWRVIFSAKHELPDWDNQCVWQLDNETLGGVTTPSSPTGQIQVVGPAINTTGFGDGVVRLVYDLEGIDGGGNVRTIESGVIVVLPDVTRLT